MRWQLQIEQTSHGHWSSHLAGTMYSTLHLLQLEDKYVLDTNIPPVRELLVNPHHLQQLRTTWKDEAGEY